MCDHATRPARRPHGRHARPARGRGGEDRRADARRVAATKIAAAIEADAARGRAAPSPRRRDRGRAGRVALEVRDLVVGDDRGRRVLRAARRRDPRRGRARGPGPGRAVRAPGRRAAPRAAARSPSTAADQAAPSRTTRSAPGVVLVPADRMLALLPQRPIRENIAAPLYNRDHALGADQPPPTSARACRTRSTSSRSTRARSARRAGCPAATSRSSRSPAGWRPASTIDAVLRPDARHRRRHQAPDLRAAARAGRGRRRDPAVHLRAAGDPARLRPRRSSLYRGGVTAEMPAAEADEAALLRAAHGLTSVEEAA